MSNNHFVLPAAVLDCVANLLEDRTVGEYFLHSPELVGEGRDGIITASFQANSDGDHATRSVYVTVDVR